MQANGDEYCTLIAPMVMGCLLLFDFLGRMNRNEKLSLGKRAAGGDGGREQGWRRSKERKRETTKGPRGATCSTPCLYTLRTPSVHPLYTLFTPSPHCISFSRLHPAAIANCTYTCRCDELANSAPWFRSGEGARDKYVERGGGRGEDSKPYV